MGKKKKISPDMYAFMRELIQESLRDWFKKEKWVRISTSGNIAGPCGTSKDTKNPDRCLPAAKARSLTKAQRAATARKKKKAGSKGKTVVKNTKKATVKKENLDPSYKHDGKSAPFGSGYRPVTKEDLTNLVVGMIHEINSNDKQFNFGYNLDAIQNVVDYLESNYKAQIDYELYIGRGDDLPNAIKINNLKLHKDAALNDLLNAAQSDEDRYDAYTDDDLNEKKDDRCTRIAKSKYDTWPSAYASGAVVRCRRGDIWKGVKEETLDEMNCKHGKYFCPHDKVYKCRKGPKKSR